MLAPTLIVGLGGTGSDIIGRVSRQVSEAQAESIRFVVFDTDVNELRQIRQDNGKIRTIQTSSRITVGEYLARDANARENWFPVNDILNKKVISEGAGQVRAISRLAMDAALKEGNIEELHKSIAELNRLAGEQLEQALRVIIVSSLAGGTGSGLILPVALYIRNYVTTKFKQNANIIRGFFILPEVFYEVITSQQERNNLRCNAYAALRELDAFMMKGDGALPERYKGLKFEIPRVGTEEYDEYNVSPYDFCFLFDGQNKDGKKLSSFEEYKDHAAKCIFAQSIGPMNKRSNSSEDNVIRLLAETGGRSRYCGAGSALLVYPFQDIKEYLSLQWLKESVSNQWLVFDQEYKKLKEENKKKRSMGFQVSNVSQEKYYLTSVNAGAENGNGFAMAIKRACSNLSAEGLEEDVSKSMTYLYALEEHVKQMVASVQADIEEIRHMAEIRLSNINAEGDVYNFTPAYTQLKLYKAKAVKATRETGMTIAYTLFHGDNGSVTKTKMDYQLETYLRDSETGSFIHPNAVRYFLCQTLEDVKKQKLYCANELANVRDYIMSFEETAFDDLTTEDVKERFEDQAEKLQKRNIVTKLVNKSQREEAERRLRTFGAKITEYRNTAVLDLVLQEAMDYVTKMIEAFQTFYTVFENRVERVKYDIKNIENKYQNSSGHAVRYVCTSKECLKKISEKAVYTNDGLDLPGELCDQIYSKVREYAMLGDEKPNNDSYFLELFDKAIIQYFRDALIESYGSILDIDVISAIEMEAEYGHEIFDREGLDRYIEDVVSSTKILAAPFIEEPIGEQRQPVRACAYHPDIYKESDLARAALVDRLLANNGGVKDEDIDKNMILFYEAIYGLRASDLSKFAPPENTKTVNRPAGEYYKAYFSLVNRIKPGEGGKGVITPHLDKRWHLISQLPDLDERSQERIENNIYKAMLYGLIFQKIRWIRKGGMGCLYRLYLGEEVQDFQVSNGSPCDKFYELLDALTINPSIVADIIKDTENEISGQVQDNVQFENSKMIELLRNFKLMEFGDSTRSVFDLVMLWKISAPVRDYSDKDALAYMKAILNVLYEYTGRFCIPENLAESYASLIKEQYTVFSKNAQWYDDNYPGVIDYLCSDILNVAISRLKDMRQAEVADYLAGEVMKLY